MKDNALTPVVVTMLILAVAVTLVSLWYSIYLPGLKQQAEVSHLGEVKEAFLRMDAEILNLIARRQNGTVVVNIPLGGGDTPFHSTRSGGYISVASEPDPLIVISGSDSNDNTVTVNLSLVAIRYSPVGNYWIDQGFTWQRGYVNVTKGSLSTPLGYSDVNEAEMTEGGGFQVLAWSVFRQGNASEIEVISMEPGKRNATSGNDIAQVRIEGKNSRKLTILNPILDVHDVDTPFGRIVNSSVNNALYLFGPKIEPFSPGGFRYNVSDHNVTFRLYTLTVWVI